MFSPRRIMLLAALAATGFLGYGSSTAMAQNGTYGGYTSGWSGYAPSYTWGNYAPNGYVRIAPAPAPNQNTAWTGYAPATGWQGYQPATAWQGYAPAQAATGYATAPSRATVSRPSATTTNYRPSAYREFGSGRPVFMHKPWLPGQP